MAQGDCVCLTRSMIRAYWRVSGSSLAQKRSRCRPSGPDEVGMEPPVDVVRDGDDPQVGGRGERRRSSVTSRHRAEA